jgi:hypothetical protein
MIGQISVKNKQYDLKQLCEKYNLPYPQDAMNAFEGKRNSLPLLREMINNVFSDQFPDKDVVLLKDTTFLDKGEIYIEAFAVRTVALTDIMAEIIKTVFNVKHKGQVNFLNITNAIATALNQEDVKLKTVSEKMQDVLKSEDYKYLRELANYAKHRSCISTKYKFPKEGLCIKDFTDKNGKTYPGCSFNELWNKYEKLHELLYECYKGIF